MGERVGRRKADGDGGGWRDGVYSGLRRAEMEGGDVDISDVGVGVSIESGYGYAYGLR